MRCKLNSGIPILLALILLTVAGSAAIAAVAGRDNEEDFALDLSLEDLLNVEITSVSKHPQSQFDAAAAVFVLTGEDLERAGVTNIPDALRLVPGLHVGRIDANKWAVTARGFNGRYSNKLLVLIDGRSLYTPMFSGVYWEQEDVMLADVERIEIIRGPGSTLWGANAVNGVINIITKHSADTQGGLAVAGAGDYEQGLGAFRWGTKLAEGTFARFYGKANSRREYTFPDGLDAGDDWQMVRGGFRLDAQGASDKAITLQGDIYAGKINQQITHAVVDPPYQSVVDDNAEVSGGNIIGRWSKTISPTSDLSLQVYFNRSVRDESIAYQAVSELDYDFQHHFVSGRHGFVWGLNYRHTTTDVKQRRVPMQNAGQRDQNLFSGFVQDEVSLSEGRVVLTVGNKFEHNDYTGWEIQPNARIMWHAARQHRLWGAVSRAVRTPSRADDSFGVLAFVIQPASSMNPAPLPVEVMVVGNGDYSSENMMAYEVGYRLTPENVSLDITAFYNDYSDLQGVSNGDIEMLLVGNDPRLIMPVTFNNSTQESNYGVEAAVAWQTRKWLRWDLAYALFRNDSRETEDPDLQGSLAPEHIMSINCGIKPSAVVDLNLIVRYVDEFTVRQANFLGNRDVPSYTALDIRLGWEIRDRLRLDLVGQNLLDKNHMEFIAESFSAATEVPRSYYARLRWSF